MARVAFLEALRTGAPLREAARRAGVSVATVYRWRRDPVFAAAWDEIRERRGTWRRRFLRELRAGRSASVAAELAGVTDSTAYRARLAHASFARQWSEARG